MSEEKWKGLYSMNHFLQKTYSDSEEAKRKALDKAQLKAYYKYKKTSAAKSGKDL